MSSFSDSQRSIIRGCVQEERVHELPKRLKWNTVPDYDEIIPIPERKAKIANVCVYWYEKVTELQFHPSFVRPFAKRAIECLIDCYACDDLSMSVDNPVNDYLWPAIRQIFIWGFFEMLPKKDVIKSRNGHDEQKLFDIFIHDILFNPTTVSYQYIHTLVFFMLKRDPAKHPKSGWLLQFDFSAKPTAKYPYYKSIFLFILENNLFNSDVVSQLLSHEMSISDSDVIAALEVLLDTEYSFFHYLFSHLKTKSSFEKAIYIDKVIKDRPNLAAIILSSLSAYNDTMADKFIEVAGSKAICLKNLEVLVPTLTSKNRSKLFLRLWKIKIPDKCATVLKSGSLDRKFMLRSFKKFTTFILDKQYGLLYEPLITHLSLDLNDMFRVVFEARNLEQSDEYYKFAVLFIMNNGDIDLLSIAYTQGTRGTALHGAVELCLKTENETELLSEVCRRIIKRKSKHKMTDSNNSSPYHVIAKWPEKQHTCELLGILASFNFIDPSLKERNNKKTALAYASKFSEESKSILSNAMHKWKGRATATPPMDHCSSRRSASNQNQHSEPSIGLASNSDSQLLRDSHHVDVIKCSNINNLIHVCDIQPSSSSKDMDYSQKHISLEESECSNYTNDEEQRNGDTNDIKQSITTSGKQLGGSNITGDLISSDKEEPPYTLAAGDYHDDVDNHYNHELVVSENSIDQVERLDSLEDLLQQLMEQPSKYFIAEDAEDTNNVNDSDSGGDSDSGDNSDHSDSDTEVVRKPTDSNDELVYQPVDQEPDMHQQNHINNAASIPELPSDKQKQSQTADEFDDKMQLAENLDFSDFKSLPWEIFLAKQANDFLKSSKTSASVKDDIIKKTRSIAEGNRSKSICHRLISPQDKLYETKLYRGARIIWCEDIQYSERHSRPEEGIIEYRDVVKIIWITLKHSTHQLNDVLQKVKSAWKKSRLVNSNKFFKPEVIDHSKYQFGRKRFPRKFIQVDQSVQHMNHKTWEKLHPLPNLFGGEFSVMQFHPIDDAESYFDVLLNNELSKRDFPISLSQHEHEIIKLPYRKKAIILCGRSGTGKTTTCIYRMWNEFQTFWSTHAENHGDDKVIHQMFLTKSPVLCSQVKKEFHKLMRSSGNFEEFESESNAKQMKVIAGGILSDYSDKVFPLFMTSRNFLLHLDSSLEGDKFFPRDQRTGKLAVQFNVYDYNEDIDPDSLLENLELIKPEDNVEAEDSSTKQSAIEINADYFCSKIWPIITSSHTHHQITDPLLIWTEIQSFIKGSREAVGSDEGHLTEDKYIALGKHVAPAFNDDRKSCYEYFKKYCDYIAMERLKNKKVFLFDENDLIFNIYKRLQKHHREREEHPLNWYINSFYIDEVQDFTQAELCVLLACSQNPNGTFCTGDIAQSIMKGVFFRFEDLKSQFHHLATCSGAGLDTVPKLHSLTENFRSHSGVLDLAQSIVAILKRQFKASFQDSNLPQEKAMFKGLKPILLETTSKDELARILLGNSENTEVPHELGAHQAIIVRSEEARNGLPDSIGGGLVLTVLEAKGLEFNDVLLYNFFSDSQVKDQWRLLYNLDLCEESPKAKEQLRITKNLHQLRTDDKQEKRLKSLLAELKHLYTAITRARMNLWIYDEGAEESKPFYYYCLANDLARLVNTSNENSDSESLIFAAPSPYEQWSKQGDYYFNLRKWDLAMNCYRKGNNYQKKYLTEGYKFVEDFHKSKQADQVKIKEAARLFLCADKSKHSIEYIEKAVKCLNIAGLHNEAALLLEKMKNYGKALSEWTLAKNMKKVAETRERLEDYSGVIRCLAYDDDKDYGTALLKAEEYEKLGHTLDDDVKPQQIAYMYIRNAKGKKIEMLDAFQFVSDGSAKATLLRELGKLEEAADEFLKAGHLDQACRILEAQSLFKKGCEILSTNNEETQAKFLLYHATFLAIKSGWKKTEEIVQTLRQLSKLPFFYFRGRSQILSALIEKDGSMLYQAITDFKHFECLPGEILAFVSLKHLQEETKPEKDLQYSKAAHDVAEAIRAARSKNNTFKQKSIYQEVHRFHDLNYDDRDENSYYISLFLLENNICPTLCSLDCSMRDEDGMVKLRTVQVDDCLSNYYSQLSIDFLKSASNYFTQLPVKLRTSEFYFALKSSTVRKSLSLDLDNYFKILKELLEYSYLMKASFDVCDSKLMFRLFSPDVAFYLYITRKNINYFKRNSKVVNEVMTSIAIEMLKDSECTLQTYFTAFRLLIAFIGKYEAQKQITQVMNSHIHPKYIFNQENTGRKLHIFNGWVETHNRIVRGDITGAVYSAYNFFFRRIANLDGNIKTDAISISTINYIVSILSTALLTILQQCQSMLTHSHTDYLIPRLFNLMLVANFELFCSNSIFNACMQQVQTSQFNFKYLSRLYNTSMTQLNNLLSFLLGEDGSNYNVLLTALTTECCIQDGSAFYCLIQSLMIASNLYIASSSSPENRNRVHAQFLRIHKILRMSSRMNSTVPEFVSSAIKCLSGARNVKDIFTFVSEILPTRFQSSDLCKVSVPNEMVYRSYYPSVPMRALVIIERPLDDDPVVEQQVLSDDDSPVNNDMPSPIEELNEPAFNNPESTDEILDQLADLPKGLVSDEYCSVCEVILFQGMENILTDEKQTGLMKKHEEYHAHLKSSGHATKLQEYKEFIEKKETIEQKILNLNVEIKTLHEVTSSIKLNKLMTDLETLKNQEVSVSNDTMKFVVTWLEGTVKLEEHHKRLQEYEELFHKLKEEYEERIKPIEILKEDEVEILPTETGPPKLSKKQRKVTTQSNSN